MISDRIIGGAVAGTAGAVGQNLYIILASILGYRGPFYIDYGKILLFNGVPRGLLPDILGLIAHFVWDVIVAILFSYIVKGSSSRYFIGKGLLYGISIWFIIKAGATITKIPIIIGVKPITVALFFLGSILYGLIIAVALKWLDKSPAL